MADASKSTDWRELREFAAVDLNRSFILSWHVESDLLMIDVDVLLTEDHAFFEKPRPAEKFCIRPAIIEFPFCEKLSVGDSDNDSIAAVVETIGHGAIEALRRHEDGRYEISGKFGVVLVTAERPLLRLKGP